MGKHSNIKPGLGLHLPDRDFFTPEEMVLARSINPTVFLAMLYEADKGGAAQTNELVADRGHEDVLARIQVDRVVDLDPVECAQIAFDRAGRLVARRVHVVMGNELNLIREGYDGDLDRVMRWLRDFALAFRALDPDRRYILHLPAPWSGDVGEDNEQARVYWRACFQYGLMEFYDVADVHEYAEGYGLHADCIDILGMETWTTEHNRAMQAAADSTRLETDHRVEAAIYFIETWENYKKMGTPRPDDEFSLTWHPELIVEFEKANDSVSTPIETPDPGPDPAPEPEPDPNPEPQPGGDVMDDAKSSALDDYWSGTADPGGRNPESEIGKYWDDHRDEMGSCFGGEHYAKDADGNVIAVYQAFAGGVWVANAGDPWTVERV